MDRHSLGMETMTTLSVTSFIVVGESEQEQCKV